MGFCLFFVNTSWALKSIECSESSCNPDFIPTSQTDRLFFSSLDLGENNQDNIIIDINDNSEPRSVRLSVNHNNFQGKNIQVDLTPNSSNANAGDFILMGDYFNTIELMLNGY